MKEKKSYQSWTISDGFWEEIKDKIPVKKRDPQKKHKHAPGQGRPLISPRKVLEGIFYVLCTGCQWKVVPRKYGCVSNIHRYYQEWVAAGFFETIWVMDLAKYGELQGIGWEWQNLDRCMIKAPLAREVVDHNPTDRGKNGDKEKRSDRWKRVTALCRVFRCQHTRYQVAGSNA